MKTQISKFTLRQSLSWRFALRWHMTLIITFSFLAGLITTKALLAGDFPMMFRYPFAVLIAYLIFLWGIWVWLHYAGYAKHFAKNDRGIFDNFDPTNFIQNSPNNVSHLPSGGGDFGGGGASASWDGPNMQFDSGAHSDIVGGTAEVLGGAEEGGCLVALVIIIALAILAVIFGAGVYFIYEAPAILTEVAFEALLAGGLVRVSKRMRYDASWSGSAIKMTWPAFLFVLVGAFLFAMAASSYAPEAKTLPEVIQKIKVHYGKS